MTRLFFFVIYSLRKKVEPKQLHLGAVFENCEGWSRFFLNNSAAGGAELHTMKRLQGWSHFGSTFFLSADIFLKIIHIFDLFRPGLQITDGCRGIW